MRRHPTPPWWDWPLGLTAHIKRRMRQRGFSETELRGMLGSSVGLQPHVAEGRFIADCRHGRERWQVILEPDYERTVLWAITAYRIS